MHRPCLRLLFLHLVLLGSAQAVTIRDNVTDAASQTLAADPAYASVGKFIREGSDITSGVLINPSYVLTAGHIIQGSPTSAFSFTIGGLDYAVVAYTTSGSDDLAIFQLASPVLNVTPALLYTGSAELGSTVTLVGYGFGGNGSAGTTGTGAGRPQGTKRAATNVINANDVTGNDTDGYVFSTSANGRFLFYDFDDGSPGQNRMGTQSQTTNEGLLAVGDSGGGLFATINSQSYLVGVNTSVYGDGDGISYNYGDLGGAVRVSTASSFISSVVPEPGVTVSLVIGLGIFAVRRRRR